MDGAPGNRASASRPCLAVFALVIALERRLPHKRMLIATGVLIGGVLVVMVGQTVQTMQVVGWLSVNPIEGLRLPYWTGPWLGLFPTWEGLGPAGGGRHLRVGSYLVAETLKRRRRARILAPAPRTNLAADLPREVGELRLDQPFPGERDGLR